MKRIFFDWSEPLLPQAAGHLLEGARESDAADLSQTIVVTNVSSAGRRLLELLVQQAEAAGLMLMPPTITTVGALPEMLYRPKRPFADAFVQRLAWAVALKQTEAETLREVVPHPPSASDDMKWLSLGQLLRAQHIELAADGLHFGNVADGIAACGADSPGRHELERWRSLRSIQEKYLSILDGLELWDRQTARLVALEKKEYLLPEKRRVVLIGAVDLSRVMRAILDHIGAKRDSVTAYIHAPKGVAARFDEHGCLIASEWRSARIEIEDEWIVQAGGPADQAAAVVEAIANWSGKYSADEITIGLPDESLASPIERRLNDAGVAARWIGGKTIEETLPARLLSALADYLELPRFAEFAALVRHPDVYDYLFKRLKGHCFLIQLDEYASEHFGGKTEGDAWLGNEQRAERLAQVQAAMDELLADFRGPARSLAEWQKPVRKFLLAIYGERLFDREAPQDRLILDACARIAEVAEQLANAPKELLLSASAVQLLRWIGDEFADEAIPPEEQASAVQLMGWLELALDDAPALVVTSFNEGFVPSSRVADAFLPDRLRAQLGLNDNARRYARDAYATSAIAASRRDLAIVVGKRTSAGDPLTPSRLLFAVDDDKLVSRAASLFGEQPPAPVAQPAVAEKKPPAAPRSRGRYYDFPIPTPELLEKPIESLAVSDFRAYLQCPYRFYLGRVLGLETLTDDMDELDGRGFGIVAHDVLQDFGNHERRHATDPDQLRALLDDLLEKRVELRFGRARAPSIKLQMAQLRQRLHAFADEQAQRASQGWLIQDVERDLGKEKKKVYLDVDGRPVELRARIDRIDWHPQHGHVIFDYKTGDGGADPESSHRRKKKTEWIDLQLPLYRHIGIELGMDRQAIDVGYVVLGRDLKKIGFIGPDWNEDDYADALAAAENVVRAIREQRFSEPTEYGPRDHDDFAAICQNRRFGRWTPEEDEATSFEAS